MLQGAWQDWTNGVLGLWIILLPFLGFGVDLQRMLLIISGIVIAVLAFWSASMKRKPSGGEGGGMQSPM